MAKLDHISIVTDDLNGTIERWEKLLGTSIPAPEEVADQGIVSTYLPLDGVGIEILEPTDPNGGIRKFLDKKGPGIHHFALKVEDREAMIQALTAAGVRLIIGSANGNKSVFIHPKSTGGVLVELCE